MRYRYDGPPIMAPPTTSIWCCALIAAIAGSMTLNFRPIRLASSAPVSSPVKCSVFSASCTSRSSVRPASSSVFGAGGCGRIEGTLGLAASMGSDPGQA